MATRELITLLGKTRYGFNVSNSVGIGGRNETGDVMLIQALFKYIAAGLGKDDLGLPEPSPLPELTGHWNPQTMFAIAMFQSRHAKSLVRVDGLIHPASYQNRDINHFKPLMTITRLHVFALASGKRQGHGDYTIGLFRTLPEMLPWSAGEMFKFLTRPGRLESAAFGQK